MALMITEECINCGVCEPECPHEAISPGDDIYVIDPNKCIECTDQDPPEPRCVEVCPVDAMVVNPDYPRPEGAHWEP